MNDTETVWQCDIVRSVRGILRGDRAKLTKIMKFGTLIVFDMLNPNLPGTKANFQWGRHIGEFKMAAIQKQIFFITRQEKVTQLHIKPLC